MNLKMDFTDYFEPHIYDRGRDIFEFSHAVTLKTITDTLISATVQGSYLYHVNIEIDDDEVLFVCTCPYAESGNLCKHMVATLLAAQNSNAQSKSIQEDISLYPSKNLTTYEEEKQVLKEFAQKANPDALQYFIINAMLEDEALKNAFLTRFAPQAIDVDYMVNTFNSIIDSYLYNNGYINYRHAGTMFGEIHDFMGNLRNLLDQGLIIETASIITEITLGFDEIPLDDSDGHTSGFYDSVETLIADILEEDVPVANDILYNWMGKVMKDPNTWYLKEYIEPYWNAQYTDEELLNMHISALEDKLKVERKIDTRGAYTYAFIHTLIDLANQMEKRGDAENDILALLEPYDNAPDVIWHLIKFAVRHEDSAEEVRLLRSGIAHTESFRLDDTRQKFKMALCQFYKDHNHFSDYKTSLKDLAIEYSRDLSYFTEYKSLFDPREWNLHRIPLIDEILKKHSHGFHIADIYVAEKMSHELLIWLKQHHDLNTLKKYYPHIDNEAKSEILTLFLLELDALARNTGSKNHYENIVRWMQYIQKLPGGESKILKCAEHYRQQYKRRKNFIAALEKLNGKDEN